jgi:anthranilate 1,2-dioxygenase (deaminating, decarboxylating) large subunit
VNFATEYAVLPFLRFGVNGYWFDQFTDTKVNGSSVAGRREHVWAIGPGAVLSFSPKKHLYFNIYNERDVKNRAEGDRYVVRYVNQF